MLTGPSKKRILDILDSDIPLEHRKSLISRDLAYQYLYRTYYPRLRRTLIVAEYSNGMPSSLDVPEEVAPCIPEPQSATTDRPSSLAYGSAAVQAASNVTRRDCRTIMALKTNLMYDAATALNFEVEFPLGDRWSVLWEDLFPWWETGNKYCFQLWEMGLEGRWWFRRTDARDRLSGHFGGMYLMSSKYDLQWDRDLDWQGEFWSAGLTYGFSLPISRHLNLELSLSAGYLHSVYRHYNPAEDYGKLFIDRAKAGRTSYWGPTKAKVSLVIPIRVPVKARKEVRYER